MKPHHHRSWILRAEALLHNVRIQPPRRPVLRGLLKKIAVGIKEKRHPRSEGVDIQAGADRSFDISDGVSERERYFLNRGRAGFANVIAADRNGVPFRK